MFKSMVILAFDAMKKLVIIAIILSVAILAVLATIVIICLNIFPADNKNAVYINSSLINKSEIGEEQVSLVLYNIEAYKLHNPLFSKDTAKISLIIGNKNYNSEIIDGEIITKKGKIENADLRITMPENEFTEILNSKDLKSKLQESVENGNTMIEMLAGKTELFMKGYLSLYKKITGKSLTGSFLR